MGRQWRQCCSAKCPLHADGPIIGSVVCGLVLRPPTSNSMHCRSSSICPLQCPMCSPPNQSRAVFTLSLTVTFDHDCRTKTEYRQNGQIAPLEKARDCPERIPPTRDGDGWVLNERLLYCVHHHDGHGLVASQSSAPVLIYSTTIHPTRPTTYYYYYYDILKTKIR